LGTFRSANPRWRFHCRRVQHSNDGNVRGHHGGWDYWVAKLDIMETSRGQNRWAEVMMSMPIPFSTPAMTDTLWQEPAIPMTAMLAVITVEYQADLLIAGL